MTIRNNFLSLMMIGLLSNALYSMEKEQNSMEEQNQFYGFKFNSESFSTPLKLAQEMIEIKEIQEHLKNNIVSDENLKLIDKKAINIKSHYIVLYLKKQKNGIHLDYRKLWNLINK